MNRLSLFSFVASLLLGAAGVATAQAPAEPTNLTVKALGTNAFQVSWKDNATNEKGYQIFLAVKGSQPTLFKTIAVVNATSDIVLTNALPNLSVTFQVAAYNGDDPKIVRSKLTPPVTVRTPSRIIFGTPAKLRATAVSDGQVSLTFNDQSNSETAFQFEFKLATDKKWTTALLPPSAKFDRSISGLLPATAYQFRIKAFRQINGLPLKSTRYSNIANVTTKPFLAPSNLVVTAEPDARFSLSATTNSDIANGYEFERKTGTGDFLVFAPNSPFVRYDPNTDYQFRIRAFRFVNSVKVYTDYSNVVAIRSTPFLAPTNLVVNALPDGGFSFAWGDPSNLESGYEVEQKLGSGTFQFYLRTQGPNQNAAPPDFTFFPDSDYQFRVRTFRTIGSVRVYSDFSNVVTTRSTLLLKPTNLVVTASTSTGVTLTWTKPSNRPTALVEIELQEVGSATSFRPLTGIGTLTFTPTGLEPFKLYEFRIRTTLTSGILFSASDFTTTVQARTKDGFPTSSPTDIILGAAYSYQIPISRVGELASPLVLTGTLPPGLTFDASTQTISGTTTDGAVRKVTLTATFNDATVATKTIILRPQISAPVINSPFSSVNVAAASSTVVALTTQFSDPDVSQAVRVATSLGTYDIVLFPVATPLTVANFLSYVSAASYDGSFFHRAPSNFVVQGGGFNVNASTGAITKVVTSPAVLNEPGISNLRGTVAMAKLGNLPNSATSEFFVNLGNNASNLDNQNGGFTVFGRVPTAGMAVLDAINLLQRKVPAYTVPVGGAPTTFADLPLNATGTLPGLLDPNQLVKVNTVATTPVLAYTVQSQNIAIATASVAGSNITINGVASGSTTVLVTATDLDGLAVSQNINVTVP